jgi:hypothetical protein
MYIGLILMILLKEMVFQIVSGVNFLALST